MTGQKIDFINSPNEEKQKNGNNILRSLVSGKSPVDSAAVGLVVLFFTVPVIIFLWGWTRIWIALCGTVLLIILSVLLFLDLKDNITISLTENKAFWLFSLLVITIWCFFSGIGGFAYQTFDFAQRNPAFNDLVSREWPIVFDTVNEPAQYLFTGAESCSYVYYFAWWLPVAAVVKIFGFGMHTANILLLLYTIIEVFLIFYCVLNILGRTSYLALFSLILFGGWDYWMFSLKNKSLAIPETAEWWAEYFSYSSHTTQLYNVFNSCLPIWLAVCLILLLRTNRCKAAVGALCFAYNPFSTLAMIPVVLAACLRSGKQIKKAVREMLSPWNIAVVLLMLGVFIPFYLRTMRNNGIQRDEGIVFLTWRGSRIVRYFAAFVLSEVLIYFLAMGWEAHKEKFYWLVLILLCLIPVYRIGYYNDFSLKVPFPLLFLLMILLLQRYYKTGFRWRRAIILTALLMGFMTSIVEIHRNVSRTLIYARSNYINQPFQSYEALDMGEYYGDLLDELFASQYLAPNRKDDLWFRYIGK